MSSTIHRFTPPTCTLELITKRLPLIDAVINRKNSAIFQKFKFKLRFDDPRQTMFQQVTIQGDQQDFLLLQTAIKQYLQSQLQSTFAIKKSQITTQPETSEGKTMPYLTPQGLIQHELFFGSLIHDCDRQSLKLGTIQLFDLVTALEAVEQKIVAWSNPQQAKSSAKIMTLVGGGIASMAIALTIILNLFKPQISNNIASDSSAPQSPNTIPELAEITPPASPDHKEQSISKLKLGDPLASTARLPPPPAVETPKPKPNIPDPADYDLSDVARQSGLGNVAKNKVASNPERQKSAATIPPTAKSETTIFEPTPRVTTSHSRTAKQTHNSANISEDISEEFLLKPQPVKKTATKQPNSIQEVTAYFEHRWQPPANLNQGLEYRLILDGNGSIKRVIPIGKAAQLYLNQTNIPLNGEPFISPLKKSQPSTIRLFLNPHGEVQVFAESKSLK